MVKSIENISLGVIGDLRYRARQSFEREHYYEAASLMHTLVDWWMRQFLRTEKKLPRKFWDGSNLTFHRLINYCEIAGLQKSSIDELDRFNRARNKLIHDALSCTEEAIVSILVNPIEVFNGSRFSSDAKLTYILGESIIDRISKKNGNFFFCS